MSGVRPERAPLFVRAYELCRQLDERRRADLEVELRRLRETSRSLLLAIAHALTFPAQRRDELARADRFVVDLRLLLRLACDAGVLTPGFVRVVQSSLLQIGAMLGGWQRSLAHGDEAQRLKSRGARPRAAATASSAAVPTGTTRGGVAPRTATGTTPTMPGTTTASGSSCPPPSPQEESSAQSLSAR